jgi:hypothetical protein
MSSQGANLSEHFGDKKPIGLLLSFLSVFGFTAWAYLDSQANLYAEARQADAEWMIVRVENVSISKHIEHGVMHVVCARDPKCVPAYDEQSDWERFGYFLLESHHVANDKHVCAAPGGFFRFSFSLQPGEVASVRVKGRVTEMELQYFGRTQGPCAMATTVRDVFFLSPASVQEVAKASVLRNSREIAIAIAAVALLMLLWLFVVPSLRGKRRAVRRRRR